MSKRKAPKFDKDELMRLTRAVELVRYVVPASDAYHELYQKLTECLGKTLGTDLQLSAREYMILLGFVTTSEQHGIPLDNMVVFWSSWPRRLSAEESVGTGLVVSRPGDTFGVSDERLGFTLTTVGLQYARIIQEGQKTPKK